MTTWRARPRRVLDWLADDEHGLPALEAYAIAVLAFGAIVFGIVSDLPPGLYQGATLACLGFLVLSTVRQRAAQGFTIADVLRDRDSDEGFARLLDGASELCFYAPSGVNVLPQHLPDVKRWVQGAGGPGSSSTTRRRQRPAASAPSSTPTPTSSRTSSGP